MGRKIPGRKHRGIKDPEKQKAERLKKIKHKINASPSNTEEQEIPKSLSKIIELKNKTREGIFKKKNKNSSNVIKENAKQNKNFKGRAEKNIPKFEQFPGESDREFKHRISRICSDFVREAAFEDKYNVDIIRNEDGKVEGVEKRSKDELEVLIKKLRKEKRANKNKKGNKKKQKIKDNEEKPRLTKSQKWALKKAEKRKMKVSKIKEAFDFGPQKDQVKFGEIAHAPPTLVVPKKAGKLQWTTRPGQKQLLLKSILGNKSINSAVRISKKQKFEIQNGVPKVTKSIDKKGKRKDLPNALRRQLDNQQKEVMEAYKMLKSKKYSMIP